MYISPKSRYKKQTIAHIIESIHLIRSFYDNNASFCVSGDFNKYPYQEILDCLGSLQNIQFEPTRKGEVLDIIITDMHTLYLPSLTLPEHFSALSCSLLACTSITSGHGNASIYAIE